MKVNAILLALFASVAIAFPTGGGDEPAHPSGPSAPAPTGDGGEGGNGGGDGDYASTACPVGLFSNLQCCATDVLGVADLDCAVPTSQPTSAEDFQSGCAAAGGKRARCCVLPVAGQALLCQTPVGVTG